MAIAPATLFSSYDLARRASVVVAVSGGSDSLALLFLVKSFLETAASRVRLVAATVDHALRAESAMEAQSVADLCRRHGIEHQILAWSGDKPSSGLMAAARDARHRLLADAAIAAGTDIVFTGHTRDDQAETVAMRAARRDGGGGLAGIAPATLFDGSVWFCRPLIDTPRAALREHLARIGERWIDDPSNVNEAFERVRVRQGLDDRQVDELARQARMARSVRVAQARGAAELLDRFGSRPAPGLFRLDPEFLVGEGEATGLALRAILATAGGKPHLPDLDRTGALAARLLKGPLRATLSRAAIDVRRSGIWIRREARNLSVVDVSAKPAIWDGRWRISRGRSGESLSTGPIDRSEPPCAADAPGTPPSLVQAAWATEPGLFVGGEFVGHAAGPRAVEAGLAATALVAPHAAYLPAFDLPLGAALRRILGLPDLPRPPWNDHIEPEA